MNAFNDNKLRKYLKYRIKSIRKGFEVVETIMDGCDRDGFKYWVECRNGWHDRSWYLHSAIEKEIYNVFDSIKTHGYRYRGAVYYYNIDTLNDLYLNREKL